MKDRNNGDAPRVLIIAPVYWAYPSAIAPAVNFSPFQPGW